MSQDIEVQVTYTSPEKKYFSQIPKIITRMGLGPYAIAYYNVLMSVAGEAGCYMKQKNLAKLVGCSDRQLRNLNEILSQPFEILNGKPLIKITRRKNEDGEQITNLIEIEDIWIENINAIESKKVIPQQTEKPKKQPIQKKNVAEPCSAPPEPCSASPEHGSDKRRTIKGYVFKENVNVKDRSFDINSHIVSFDPSTYVLPNGMNLSLRMQRSIAKYSNAQRQKLLANVYYFEDQISKGVTFDNPEAYLQACIKNNYAKQLDSMQLNRLYAMWVKEANNLGNMEVLKTVATLDSRDGQPKQSIKLSLPPETFSAIIDKFAEQNKE